MYSHIGNAAFGVLANDNDWSYLRRLPSEESARKETLLVGLKPTSRNEADRQTRTHTQTDRETGERREVNTQL